MTDVQEGVPTPVSTSALANAAEWLRGWMAQCEQPVKASVVFAAAKQAGHSERSLRRAAATIGVQVTRRGWGGGTRWALAEPPVEPESSMEPERPASPQPREQDEPPSQPPGVRVPTGAPDPFGRYRERVEVSDAASASQWDERVWHRLG